MEAPAAENLDSDGAGPAWPPERIAVGIVLFHPPSSAHALIGAANKQFASVFLVDNTPGGDELTDRPDLRRWASQTITNDSNYGLAVAFNQLCAAARAAGFEWLLLLDQDSALPDDFALRFRSAMESLRSAPGIFAANYFTRLAGATLPGYAVPQGQKTGRVLTAINSGSLIHLGTHEALGGYDEALFIDHVDHDYCLRLKKHGSAIHATREPLFEHQIGQVIGKRRFGRVWQSSGHSPQRRQEWARGLAWMIKRYWRTAPGWCAERLFIEWPRHVMAMLILEDQRRQKTLALVKGLVQGMLSSPSPPRTYNPS